MRHKINSYVLYRDANDWHEGRISNITYGDAGEIYHVFSFLTFTELVFTSDEALSSASPELRRKMKSSPFANIPNKVHVPLLLKSIMVADKEWATGNLYDLPPKVTAAAVIRHFKDFMTNNSGACESDEIAEACAGFICVFNAVLPRFLLYQSEKEQYERIKGDPVEAYGPVHLLRLIYFLQKRGKNYVCGTQTVGVVLDYTVYLSDFLLLKHKEYF